MKNPNLTTPAIYVADLAAYNAGKLVGKWIKLDPSMDADELHTIIQRDVLLPGHEEWAIHDHEGFGPIKLNEYASIETVAAHVDRMGDDPDKYFAWIEAHGAHYGDSFDPDLVYGPYENAEDYAWDDLDNIIGNHTLGDWLQAQGMPESLTYGIKFDPEAYIFALQCNTGLSFVKVSDGCTYVVDSN